MRELTSEELSLVAGGTGECTPDTSTSTNNYNGVTDPSSVGGDLINIYEGVVAATSHMIERVANSFK